MGLRVRTGPGISVQATEAGPFLVSDPQPYDPSGGDRSLPTGYKYTMNYNPDDDPESRVWGELASEKSGSSIWIRVDIHDFASGDYDVGIKAYNAWGESAIVPIRVSGGELAAPEGVRVAEE